MRNAVEMNLMQDDDNLSTVEDRLIQLGQRSHRTLLTKVNEAERKAIALSSSPNIINRGYNEKIAT